MNDNLKKGRNRKISIAVIILILAIILISVFFNNIIDLFRTNDEKRQNEGKTVFSYTDEFDDLNSDFWWTAKWVTLEDASSDIDISNGIINLPVNETDRGPFLISKPISIEKGDIITLKRRAFMHYANEFFDGIMMIVPASNDIFKVKVENNTWDALMNHPLMVVEYAHYYYKAESRAYTDGFVLKAKDPESDKNYVATEPLFDEWFYEEITYNTGTGEVIYNLNGKELKGTAGISEEPYIRIIMHGYGWYTGHNFKIDNFEIEILR